ncbi:hypothetical protein [Moritella viscosa]|uniref:Uncharacterized protein n=1 Tax=Moritella viscosa TaxID=80854 RepID=A0ABY1HGM5_9GAMM|nr:hypothetical protein [Moritella viscosa]SGY95836.1 Putative uncharacterized protein [Moritella viscosa]SGZ01395.1 Putative uncharacterized protein [Moritella viscosa]SGZ08151.1 Putative uncharacterized protein [Moritella viscosa]SHO27157.1 Putative uncharacterized protein [Moritella viscosa]
MEAHKLILEYLIENPNVESINESSEIDIVTFKEMINHKLVSGMNACSDIGDCFLEPRITFRGREWLESKKVELVSKEPPETNNTIEKITYNISGHNARVNNHSVDNSTNTVNMDSSIVEHILALRNEITRLVDSSKQKDAFEVVDAVENQFMSGNPSKLVVSTLLSALPDAASVASIGSFLLSCLS